MLSGDGGDELFGGYNHYFEALAQWQRMQQTPGVLRRVLRSSASTVAMANWKLVDRTPARTGKLPAWARFGAKLDKATRGWAAGTPQQVMLERFARFERPADLVAGCGDVQSEVTVIESPFSTVEASPRQRCFHTVDPREAGKRVRLVNSKPLTLLVHAQRTQEKVPFEHSPMQSNYVATWGRHGEPDTEQGKTPGGAGGAKAVLLI